jgi:hypothetical protein
VNEPAWLAYTGAITGIVGAVTGIAGAVMGYVSYRRTEDLKRLDLRVEVRKLLVDTHAVVAGLPDVLHKAYRSRRAVASATGKLGSGRQKQWEESLAIDRAQVQAIHTRLPDSEKSFAATSQEDLEAELLRIHAISNEALALQAKYLEELKADDLQRDHIRNDQRMLTQTRLTERK